jgi:hypothetical protein
VRLVWASEVLQSRNRSRWRKYLPRVEISALDLALAEKVEHKTSSNCHTRYQSVEETKALWELISESETREAALVANGVGECRQLGGVCVTGLERLLGESCEINDLKQVPLGHSFYKKTGSHYAN